MRAFADTREIDIEELLGAPLRWPHPSRLAGEPAFAHSRQREAAATIGIVTVADLLDHLPRGTGEARTIDRLDPGETATVLVEVRSITTRPVRRRGMKPLVEAVVGDETGVMQATFFNQPWLARS